MSFKGTPNREGRKPGTPNKATADIRQSFKLLIENNLSKLQSDLDGLEPFARLKVIIELSKFVLPTLRSTELSTVQDGFNPITVTIVNEN